MATFGEQLKDLRIKKELTLRQCSEQVGVDPSNWSKFERGVNPAPKDIAILENWAAFFVLCGAAKQAFFDAAALSRGAELDERQLKQFVEDVRALHSPDPERHE